MYFDISIILILPFSPHLRNSVISIRLKTCQAVLVLHHKFLITHNWCFYRVDFFLIDTNRLAGFQREDHLEYLFRRWDSELKVFIDRLYLFSNNISCRLLTQEYGKGMHLRNHQKINVSLLTNDSLPYLYDNLLAHTQKRSLHIFLLTQSPCLMVRVKSDSYRIHKKLLPATNMSWI